MNWRAMADKANQVFQQRGRATAAKEDTEELRNIAQGQGSVADKVKQAAEALREPGAHHSRRAIAGSGRCAIADLIAAAIGAPQRSASAPASPFGWTPVCVTSPA